MIGRITARLARVASFDRSDVRYLLVIGACLVGFFIGNVLIPVSAAPDPVALKIQGPDTVGNLLPVQVFPAGAGGNPAITVAASSANAAASNNLSLPAGAGTTTYVSGFEITGGGATAGSIITVTITNVIGGTLNYQLVIPAGAGVSINPLIVEFVIPLQANAVATSPVLTVPSFGAGNTNAAATIHGFRQ